MTSDASLAAAPNMCLGFGSTPACQLCVGVTLRCGEMLPEMRRVSDPPPVSDPADPSSGKALVPWMPVGCRLQSTNLCICKSGSRASCDG